MKIFGLNNRKFREKMDDAVQNLSKVNAIAFDGNLRDQLKTLHDMLGVEVTDISTGAYQFGLKFTTDAGQVLKYMSAMAAKLTLALMKAKDSKKTLSEQEKADYEKIKSLTNVLGNLEDRLNTVINLSRQINDLNFQINDASMKLADAIVDSQAKFREVRSSINSYGFLSINPDLANLFDEARKRSESLAKSNTN